MPVADVAFHLVLEGIGAISLRCAFGLCKHTHHRLIAWTVIAVPMSALTVHLVG